MSRRVSICFTTNAIELVKSLNARLNAIGEEPFCIYAKMQGLAYEDGIILCEESVLEWAKSEFNNHSQILFVGAIGIAIRAIAPYVDNKMTDSPVIVMDDNGRFVVPILSGHLGGANEIALMISKCVDATPVITTSTDINSAFSVDLFAKENNLIITNKDDIKKINSKSLADKKITLSVKDYPPKDYVDVLVTDESDIKLPYGIMLTTKRYAVGMGFKQGKSFAELYEALDRVLVDNSISYEDIFCIATIDIKEDEEGLIELRDKLGIPVISFDADILSKAEGDFTASDFVLRTVGVDNVCERSAKLALGASSEIIVNKTAFNGVTVAIAKRTTK